MDAEYTTFVFRHKDEEAARALNREMMGRFPFGEREAETSICAVAIGDAMSVTDAMRMALETKTLDSFEQRQLALEFAECVYWKDCMRLAEKWELRVEDGEFVDARERTEA